MLELAIGLLALFEEVEISNLTESEVQPARAAIRDLLNVLIPVPWGRKASTELTIIERLILVIQRDKESKVFGIIDQED
jgi:hypothetical protein